MNPPEHSPDDPPMVMVVYQLAEIKSQLERGFHTAERRSDNMDMKMDLMAKAISDLQKFQAATEARDMERAANGNQVNARWIPIGVAIVSVLVIVIVALAQQ